MIHLAMLIVSTVIVGATALCAIAFAVSVFQAVVKVLSRPLLARQKPPAPSGPLKPLAPPPPLHVDPIAAADVRRRMLAQAEK
jgi:hypothetical protein